MDEIVAFIESLRNCNTKNIADYCLRCRELITNVEIHGAKKIIRVFSCSIQIDNICIKTIGGTNIKDIEILINNKYIRFDNVAIKCLLINQQNEVACYSYDVHGGYLYFIIDSCSKVNGDIDWLLNHKSTKSARK